MKMTQNQTIPETAEVRFFIGSDKHRKYFDKGYDSLGKKSIEDYLVGKGIRYTKPVTMSSYQTPEKVAYEARNAEKSNHKLVVVIVGGHSFALPGSFATHTETVPVIAVPLYLTSMYGSDIGAFATVANLPTNTIAGCAPIHYDDKPSIDKAVLLAEKIINFRSRNSLALICPPEDQSIYTQMAKKILNPPSGLADSKIHGGLGIPYRNVPRIEPNDEFDISINIANNDAELLHCDFISYIAVQVMRQLNHTKSDFVKTIEELEKTCNTLYFGNSANAALFIARVFALEDKELKRKLREYHALVRYQLQENSADGKQHGAQAAKTPADKYYK